MASTVSQAVEVQVSICVQKAVVPVKDQLSSRYLPSSLYYQLDNLIEMVLARFDVPWVYVGRLKSCKEQLAWAGLIAVWSDKHDRQTKFAH